MLQKQGSNSEDSIWAAPLKYLYCIVCLFFVFPRHWQADLCSSIEGSLQPKKILPTHSSLLEEGLGRDGVDEPLEQLARSLPAVVDSRQVGQEHI